MANTALPLSSLAVTGNVFRCYGYSPLDMTHPHLKSNFSVLLVMYGG